MGLFRKKTGEPGEIEALRLELAGLRERLDEADLQKAQLLTKLDAVDRTNSTLNRRVETLDETSAEIGRRVVSFDASNSLINERVGMVNELSSQVEQLTRRLTTAPPSVPPPPPPSRIDPRIDELISRINSLESMDAQVHALSSTITDRRERPPAAPGELGGGVPPHPPPRADSPAVADTPAVAADDRSLDELTERLDSFAAALADQREELTTAKERAEEVEAMRSQLALLAERMSALDTRLSSVSVELTNQLTELSNDLEVLIEQPQGDPDAPKIDPHQLQLALSEQVEARVGEALGQINKSTERLANEQARYEIKFREDLAELAERLRRPART